MAALGAAWLGPLSTTMSPPGAIAPGEGLAGGRERHARGARAGGGEDRDHDLALRRERAGGRADHQPAARLDRDQRRTVARGQRHPPVRAE
jgi:hypothetical protein